jgi:16S rRNA (guanine527-N7)-methyltransferase
MISYNEFLKKQQSFLPQIDVSRETFEKLSFYVDKLFEANQKFNLIGSKEKEHIWERHVFDSMQLFQYIEKRSSVCDVGSGAGFPGIVLGILGVKMLLVESNKKKAAFLEYVSRETSTQNKIICERVENLKSSFDVVTARALAPLERLLTWCEGIYYEKTIFIFPKGQRYREEIERAHKKFAFDVVSHHSVTDENGKILVIKNVQKSKSSSRC